MKNYCPEGYDKNSITDAILSVYNQGIKACSRLLLGAIIAPNLVPWVLKKKTIIN